ncbi:MAG: DUF2330 domain-containing protein [Deltaproteobacteria bacterium]|uniref:DUF2330 domain-containing protein n=1 Tax=Candidatus Zymogenus saltonus TaxID=2844893 RepID=A0A9D8PPW8_9DELT|nr:DUF2330 domain-containing protein [Candidatus Zymogenus saltonus]
MKYYLKIEEVLYSPDKKVSKNTRIVILLFILLTLSLTIPISRASADRGSIAVTAEVDSSVFEPSQNAVIAWNGVEEILILTTDSHTSKSGKILEFIPLPAKPTAVEEAPEKTFERALRLIIKKAPRMDLGRGTKNGREVKGKVPGIEVVMETTIGPHDVTVVRVEDVDDFYRWLKNFFEKEGFSETPRQVTGFKSIVSSYIDRGINYFVFDLVDAKENPEAVKPLLYRFRTERLYYPLYISSRIAGDTKITLFLVTPGVPKEKSLPRGFSFENYVLSIPDQKETKRIVEKMVPISFPISLIERVFLSPPIATLISGFDTRAYFSVVYYEGPPRYLRYDFELSMEDFISSDFECAERSRAKREGFENSIPEGYKDIVLDHPSNRFKTGGSDDYTSSASIDGDPETPYTLNIGGSWWIDLGSETEIDAVEILAAVKVPDIDPSKNSLYLFGSDTGEFGGEEKRINTTYLESHTTPYSSDNPYHNAKRLRLNEKRFKARYIKITYPYSESTSPIYLFEVMVLLKKRID